MNFRAALRNPEFWPWMLITAGVVLRLWHLASCSPLWYDETFTALLISRPIPEMFRAIAGDVHPPLFYLLLRGWAALFGSDAFGLRLFSASLSILAMVQFKFLAEELHLSQSARLVALVLFCFLPMNIYNAQEARMYALLQLLLILQLRGIINRAWKKTALFTLAALYTHNYAALYTVAAWCFGFLQEIKRPREVYRPVVDGLLTGTGVIPLLASLGIPGLLWLPWVAVTSRQMGAISGNYWTPPLSAGSMLQALYQVTMGLKVIPQLVPVSILAFSLGGMLLLLSALKPGRKPKTAADFAIQRPPRLSLLILLFVPLALVILISAAWQSIISYRYLVGLLAPLSLLAGIAISGAGMRGRLVAAALCLPLLLGLVGMIAASEVHNLKDSAHWPANLPVLPVVHLDDATIMISPPSVRGKGPGVRFLLDAGCPRERGALTPETRAALGIVNIKPEQLPQEYLFAAKLYPISTACHYKVFQEITSQADQVIIYESSPLEQWGIYHVSTLR